MLFTMSKRKTSATRPRRLRLSVETLEDRTVPTAATVPLAPLAQAANPVVFAWATVSDADHYDLWVDDVSSGQTQVIRETSLGVATFTPAAPLVLGHQYQWWVRAV